MNLSSLRNIRIIIALLAVSVAAVAAAKTVQKGVVQEYNEKAKRTPLAGVELEIKFAQSTVSNKNGEFELNFNTKNPGDGVVVRNIRKDKYEVFNTSDLEQWNINPNKPFVIKMCRSDRFKRICDSYHKASSASYKKQYDKELASIEKLRKEQKLKEKEYYAKLQEAESFYELQLDNLDNYVDKFARIDISELSETEQEIIELLQQGKMDEAIAKYEEQRYVEKLLQGLDNKREVIGSITKLEQISGQLSECIDSIYVALKRQIKALALAGGRENNAKICDIYRRVADADTTNCEWLTDAAYNIYRLDGKYQDALHYGEMALAAALDQFGPDSRQVGLAYHYLGGIYVALSDVRALECFQKELGYLMGNTYTPENEIAKCYNNIGVAYLRILNDLDKSMEFHQKALEIRERDSEEMKEDLAYSYYNLGIIYRRKSEYDKALEYHLKALEIREKELNPTHPDIAYSNNEVGLSYLQNKNLEKAWEYLGKALDIRKKVLPDYHPNLASSYSSLGILFFEMQQFQNALEYYQKSLEIQSKIFGSESVEVARCFNNMANANSCLQRYDEALEYNQKSLDIFEKQYGTFNHEVADIYSNAGVIYNELKDYDKAIACYNKSLEIYDEIACEDKDQYANVFMNIGTSYKKLGDLAKALEYYQRSLAIRSDVFGPMHRLTADLIVNISYIYSDLGDYEKTIEYYTRALEIYEKIYGIEQMVNMYYSLATEYYNHADYLLALEKFEKLIAICEMPVNNPESHKDYIADVLNLTSYCHLNLSNIEKAIETISRAVELYPHPNFYDSMAEIMLAAGRRDDAFEALRQVEERFPEYDIKTLPIYPRVFPE